MHPTLASMSSQHSFASDVPGELSWFVGSDEFKQFLASTSGISR